MRLSAKKHRFVLFAVILIAFACRGFAAGPEDFTIVLLPDTQYYTDKHPDTYVAQTTWIKEQAKPRNIKFVIHLGDIVDDGPVERMWAVADRAHRVLDGVVPHSMLPGNHDMNDDKRDTTLYNKYFSPKRFENCPWYGGHEGKTNDNNFCRFEAGGMKFLVVSLQYDPSDETLAWAGKVIDAHADHRAIVATHSYLGLKGRTPEGERIWEKLVRKHPSVFTVQCGHICGLAKQTSTNDAGRPVHEILTDYQAFPNSGDGWLRTLRFAPRERKIYVEAYSPTLNQFNKDPKHTYVLDWPQSDQGVKAAAAKATAAP